MYKISGNLGLDHIGIVVPNATLAAEFLMEVFDAKWDWEVKRQPTPTASESEDGIKYLVCPRMLI